ncbi:MAG TPA: NADH-quinone oxidoreductase subunit L, partial [Candidatus Kapabacteria bacterium]|nr:NADH-quinone oxidoreductase subunit L [Candidatus Kapabacteria bacterium]
DEILWQAFNNSPMLWLLGVVAALCTAFYMWRALTLTFYGKPRFDEHKTHPHEAPKTMTIPLIILAVLSIGAGFIGMPKLFGVTNIFEKWLEPVFAQANDAILLPAGGGEGIEITFMLISVLVAVGGILLAMWVYKSETKRAVEMKAKMKGIYALLYNKYYIDEFYQTVIVRPLDAISTSFLWKFFDVSVIDGAVNGLAAFFARLSSITRKAQTGFVQIYAVSIVVGIIIIVGWFAFF